MGTRHLTIVQKGGKYKVAQYGQWDGYPEYTGVHILDFCKGHLANEEGRNTFGEKVAGCKFVEDKIADALINDAKKNPAYQGYDADYKPNWAKVFPQFSRDTGCDVLLHILESEDGILLQDALSFVADSVFCEWAWVIDLDKNTFEGFKGFCKKKPKKTDRFYTFRNESGYQPCCLVAKWSLDALPNQEDFLKAFAAR